MPWDFKGSVRGPTGATGPAGTTSWLGITDIPASIVYTDTAQTLTLKTLTSPTLTGTTKLPTTANVELYNTTDQSTNYERFALRWNNNQCEIGNYFGGTGTTPRAVVVGVSAGAGNAFLGRAITIQNSIPFISTTGGTSAIGATALNGTLIRLGQSTGQLTGASQYQTMVTVTGTAAQTGTASYTALLIDVTETSTGSGTKHLINAQVGGSSKFVVDNTGAITSSGVVKDTNGNIVFNMAPVASSVNNVYTSNAITNNNPAIGVQGSDTDIGLSLVTKNAGKILIVRGNGHSTLQAAGGYNSGNVNLDLRSQGTGVVQINGNAAVSSVSVPATATSTGTAGTIAYDSSYVYCCVATNTWRRAALSTW